MFRCFSVVVVDGAEEQKDGENGADPISLRDRDGPCDPRAGGSRDAKEEPARESGVDDDEPLFTPSSNTSSFSLFEFCSVGIVPHLERYNG